MKENQWMEDLIDIHTDIYKTRTVRFLNKRVTEPSIYVLLNDCFC
jgi:hypothetical protein